MTPTRRHAALLGVILLWGCRTPPQPQAPPPAAAPPSSPAASPDDALIDSAPAPPEPAPEEAAAPRCAAPDCVDKTCADKTCAPEADPPAPICDGGERCDPETTTTCPGAEACFEGCCLPLAVERCILVLTEKIGWQTRSKWEVDRASAATLDAIAATLLRLGSPPARIEVHTDSKGSSKYGMKPTQRRADAVRRELVERGVDPKSLVSLGYGEDVPIATNETPEGRAKNRRVEVVLEDCRRRAAAQP